MILLLPIIVMILILLSAMLAASETAIFSLTRLEHTREQLTASVQNAIERLMRGMRDAIAAGAFADHAAQTLADLARGDISPL